MGLLLGVRYKLHHRGNGEPQLEFTLKLGQRATNKASREGSKETRVEQTRETRIPRVFQGVTDCFTHTRSRVIYKRALSTPASRFLGQSGDAEERI